MEVIFHRLADREYGRACRTIAAGGGNRRRFVDAVEAAVMRIAANPGIGSPAFGQAFGQYRWTKAGRFRYVLYYRQVAADRIRVYAVAHTSRRPGYWLRRATRP